MNATVKFIYDKSMRKPRKLENNVFVIYTPEKIKLEPGEIKTINTKVKIHLSKNLVGCCTLLKAFSDNQIKLPLNSQHTSMETNVLNLSQPVNLPWNLHLAIQKENMAKNLKLNKKLEIRFFYILND